MPPVAMTRVMPTPTITMAQTWVRLTLSVCQVAKFGVMARLNRIRSASAIQAPWRVRKVLTVERGALHAPEAGWWPCQPWAASRALLMPMSHGGHDALLADRLALQFRDRAAVAQDEDAARRLDHLLELRGDHQHAEPLAGQLPDQAQDLGLGAHIDAAGRLVEDQELGVHAEPAGEQHLLLVAAGELADPLLRARRSGCRAA